MRRDDFLSTYSEDSATRRTDWMLIPAFVRFVVAPVRTFTTWWVKKPSLFCQHTRLLGTVHKLVEQLLITSGNVCNGNAKMLLVHLRNDKRGSTAFAALREHSANQAPPCISASRLQQTLLMPVSNAFESPGRVMHAPGSPPCFCWPAVHARPCLLLL